VVLILSVLLELKVLSKSREQVLFDKDQEKVMRLGGASNRTQPQVRKAKSKGGHPPNKQRTQQRTH
jgi:hypothetical protein